MCVCVCFFKLLLFMLIFHIWHHERLCTNKCMCCWKGYCVPGGCWEITHYIPGLLAPVQRLWSISILISHPFSFFVVGQSCCDNGVENYRSASAARWVTVLFHHRDAVPAVQFCLWWLSLHGCAAKSLVTWLRAARQFQTGWICDADLCLLF